MRRSILSRLLLATTLALAAVGDLAACTIYVSHNADADPPFWTFSGGSDSRMLLREAAEVGRGDARCYTTFEKDRIEGGNFVNDPVLCGTLDNSRNWRLSVSNPGCGPNDADTIRFWDNVNGGANIGVGYPVLFDPRDSIDGAPSVAGARANAAVIGPGPGSAAVGYGGIRFDPLGPEASGSVRNLYIENFRFAAISAINVNGLSIKGVGISRISASGGIAYGVQLGYPQTADTHCVFSAQVGGSQPGEQNYFYDIAGTAISITDSCGDNSDRNNHIVNNYIGMCEALDTGPGLDGCADGTANQAIAGAGILIDNTPNVRIGGSAANEGNTIGRSADAGIRLQGARTRDAQVFGNVIGLSRTGFSRPNGAGVVLGASAYQNQIGGGGAGQGNTISGNSQHAVRLNAGDGNAVAGNVIGMNPARTQARANGIDGVAINGGSGTTVGGNTIAHNGGWGVYIDGGSGHTISNNVIGLRGAANNANDNTTAGNAGGGVWVNGAATVTIGPGNRIAGNGGAGVQISGENADGTIVRGNVIGLSAGNDLRPNTGGGVLVADGPDGTAIGGLGGAGDRNVISGNTGTGVRLAGPAMAVAAVTGNYIGTGPLGSGDFGNSARGIEIDAGVTTAEVVLNVIAGNNSDGVTLVGATGTSLRNNTIGLDTTGAAMPNNVGVALLAGTTGASVGTLAAPNVIAGNASFGVVLADAGTSGNTIAGNSIGSALAGRGNGGSGVLVFAGAGTTDIIGNTIIGQATASGVELIGSANNTVRGNRIGLTAAGAVAANLAGIRVVGGSSGNVIGGAIADRNFIGGNGLYGIAFGEAGTSNNNALNNFIGIDPGGASPRANGIGVLIEGSASSNTVSQNVISGNVGDGVLLQGASNDNRVQLNRIGLAASGSATLANGGNGIRIIGSSGTLVGSVPGFGNLLRGNTLAGIRVESGSGNNLDYNGILANGGLGIDLGPLGITTNDALDADAGANDLLNFATLSNVVQNGASVSMTVTQSGLPSRQQVPSVYASSACDPSGNGEGETWLGNITLTTNAAGVAAANILLPLPSAAPVPAFTATTFANLPSGETTSEFSPCANNNGVMFANGFETGAAAAGVASDSKVMEGFERSSDSEGRLLLRYHNGGALLQPGRSLTVVADHAVIVEAIDADGLVCELAGAIICEVPALAAGQTATLAVQLGVGATRPTLWVEARGADGTLERRVFPLAPR